MTRRLGLIVTDASPLATLTGGDELEWIGMPAHDWLGVLDRNMPNQAWGARRPVGHDLPGLSGGAALRTLYASV